MTPDEAFLEAILEAPDDDTPRLIYADWLEEHGDPRGEFIRLQCWLASKAEDDPFRSELAARERKLLVEHEADWLGPLHSLLKRWTFRRGFLDDVTLAAGLYLDHADALHRVRTLRRIEVDLTEFQPHLTTLEWIPESVARENIVFPLGFRGRRLVIALREPHDLDLLAKLQFMMNREIETVAASDEQLVEAINRCFGPTDTEVVDTVLAEFVSPAPFFDELIDFDTLPEDDGSPVAKLVNLILREALALRATEIRIEPLADVLHVRYRINGAWMERDTPPRRLLAAIVARVTHMAAADDGRKGRGRKGRLRGNFDGAPFDLGVSIRDTAHGPRVVIAV